MTETYDIYQDADGMHASDNDGNPVTVEAGQHVSMNMFGLPMGFLTVSYTHLTLPTIA